MGRLCVIDVSAVVHTGVYSPRYAQMSAFGYPTAGINFFMQQLMVPLYDMDDVILCFDSPNFRHKKDPNYKSGRSHSALALSNIEVLYEYLSLCGIGCYKVAGYEADDIIEWVVEKYWKDYSAIIIVGNDKDLAHSMRPNTMFRSCRSDMNMLQRSSFPNAVIRDVYLPYNMTSVYKSLCGCSSDSVPAFHTDDGRHGKELYADAVKFYEEHGIVGNYYQTTSRDVFRVWAKYNSFTDEDLKRLDERMDIIFPAPCPFEDGGDFKPANRFTVDVDKLSKVLTMFNVYEALKSDFVYRVQLTEDEKKEVYKLANDYKSGAFNADKSIPMKTERVTTAPLRIDAFEKDF